MHLCSPKGILSSDRLSSATPLLTDRRRKPTPAVITVVYPRRVHGLRSAIYVWPVALNPAALRVRRQADPFDAVVTAATIRHSHYG